MEPESSLPYSQAPATCPYPEPTPSSPHNPFPLPEDPSCTVPPLSHLTSCTPTTSNLYLANSLSAALSEPALYRLLTFHVPNKMSLYLFLLHDASPRNTPHRRTEWGSSLPPDSFASRGFISHEYYVTFCFSRGGVVSTSPNPQAGGPPLVGCPRLLIQCICSCPPYRRPFLHPQPEDAPCCGDRDPQNTAIFPNRKQNFTAARCSHFSAITKTDEQASGT
jgi:hypothetical protein